MVGWLVGSLVACLGPPVERLEYGYPLSASPQKRGGLVVPPASNPSQAAGVHALRRASLARASARSRERARARASVWGSRGCAGRLLMGAGGEGGEGGEGEGALIMAILRA